MFIVIEGVDGSGKSSLCKSIIEKYSYKSYKSIGGTFAQVKSYFDIDKVNIHERFSFLCGESINNSILIKKSKNENLDIVFDRYYYSTLVYCETFKQGISNDFDFLFSSLEQPDLVLFVSVSFKTMVERVVKRGNLTLIENNFLTEDNYNNLIKNYFKYLPKNTVFLDNNSSFVELERKAFEILDKLIISDI